MVKIPKLSLRWILSLPVNSQKVLVGEQLRNSQVVKAA